MSKQKINLFVGSIGALSVFLFLLLTFPRFSQTCRETKLNLFSRYLQQFLA